MSKKNNTMIIIIGVVIVIIAIIIGVFGMNMMSKKELFNPEDTILYNEQEVTINEETPKPQGANPSEESSDDTKVTVDDNDTANEENNANATSTTVSYDYKKLFEEAKENIFWYEPNLVSVYGTNEAWQYLDKNWDGVMPISIVDDVIKYIFVDKDGHRINNEVYDNLEAFSNDRIKVAKIIDDKWLYGMIDKEGKEIIPCKYKEMYKFTDDMAVVGIDTPNGERYGVIDKTGKEVIPYTYNSIHTVSEDLAVASIIDETESSEEAMYKFGYIDKTGKEVIPFIYSFAEGFSEGLALVSKIDDNNNETMAFIDKKGNKVIDLGDRYYTVGNFNSGRAYVAIEEMKGDTSNLKFGYIDNTGKVVIPMIYSDADIFAFDKALVCKGEDLDRVQYGYIDVDGNEIVEPVYGYIEEFSDGITKVGILADASADEEDVENLEEGTYVFGFLDKKGDTIAECQYIVAERFSEGLAPICKKGDDCEYYYGYINMSGEETIPADYYFAIGFSDDLAAVQDGDTALWGFIDKTGKLVVDYEYDEVSSVVNGMAVVQKGNTVGLLRLKK